MSTQRAVERVVLRMPTEMFRTQTWGPVSCPSSTHAVSVRSQDCWPCQEEAGAGGDSTRACQPHLPISIDGSQDRIVAGFWLPFQALVSRRHSCSASQAPSESPDKCSRSCRDQGCADLESWLRCPWSLSPSLAAMVAITRPLLCTSPQECLSL